MASAIKTATSKKLSQIGIDHSEGVKSFSQNASRKIQHHDFLKEKNGSG